MAGYVGDVKIGSTTYPVGSTLYGTCDTAAATVAKVVTLAAFDTLKTGVTIHVKMTNSNTAASPTLNVNSTGAKAIKMYGTTAVGTTTATSWNAGAIVTFTYDGTNWVMNDFLNTDTNTTYTAATAAPGKVASASSTGTSTNYARQDHTHGIDLATGDNNGQVKIAGTNVSVKGLAAMAYKESVSKSDVGLGNVDNTSDVNKPISTATQTALNAKADKADMEEAEKFRIHVVKGTQTAGTAAWTGEIDVDALYDGLTIAYYLPQYSGSNVTLNLTLSGGGTTGAKEVWVSGNTRMSTHYPPGSTVYLTYWSAGSISINGTATTTDRWVGNEYWNSNTVGEYAGACIAGPNGMARYSLIMQVDDDHWESLVTTSTTAATKTKNTSGFLLSSPILYQSGSTYAENGVAGYSSVWSTAYGLDSRYSFNCTNAWSSAGKPLYLVGTISGNKFYLKDTTWWADELPSAGDSTYVYWYVGQMYSAYQYTLHPVHPIWEYVGGAWKVRQVDALWYRGAGSNSVHSIASFSSGTLAVAEGNNSHAEGEASHSEGGGTYATKQYAHAEGSGTNATGNYSHSEGGGSTASGDGSHAEGNGTTASGTGAHSEGGGSRATAHNAHAEGGSTTASATGAHAEGAGTTASAQGAHAEGQNTMASGGSAHAEGSNTTASGSNSHSEGGGTIANHASQHVFGEYNVADPSTASASSRGTYVEIVGNGTSSTRSNVRTLEWNGNEWIAGSQSASDVLLPLTSGSNTRTSLLTYLDNMQQNFQDGCSTIATAITNAGVTTASNASPSVMATNIATLAENKYDEGYADGNSSAQLEYIGTVMTNMSTNHTVWIYSATVQFTKAYSRVIAFINQHDSDNNNDNFMKIYSVDKGFTTGATPAASYWTDTVNEWNYYKLTNIIYDGSGGNYGYGNASKYSSVPNDYQKDFFRKAGSAYVYTSIAYKDNVEAGDIAVSYASGGSAIHYFGVASASS